MAANATTVATLYGRQVLVRIIPPSGPVRELRGLRVSWQTKKSTSGTPATATVTVYNPSPDSLSAAQTTGTVVELWVGYAGQDANGALDPTRLGTPKLIWRGNPVAYGVKYESRPPERLLIMELADGGTLNASGRVSISFATQTTPAQVLTEALRQLQIPTDTTAFPTQPLYPSFHFVGKATALFAQIAQDTGNSWYIRDGAFAFQGINVPSGSAVLISASTGMVGSPTPKSDGTAEVTILINPAVIVGGKVVIESRAVNGTYTVQSIETKGDSGFSTEFYMSLVCVKAK